ncbi:integrase core domain-containing protein [Corynebacterium sp. YSMAA1_1_F7]|uniref:integrase core domain-containing protein n=1 Tax=Corynebacterium sp. YSMAA1_1_F7 TaxID=3383590 RepID=UPI0038D00898
MYERFMMESSKIPSASPATLRWVHWWNTKRLHEALDYATPREVDIEYYLTEPVGTG